MGERSFAAFRGGGGGGGDTRAVVENRSICSCFSGCSPCKCFCWVDKSYYECLHLGRKFPVAVYRTGVSKDQETKKRKPNAVSGSDLRLGPVHRMLASIKINYFGKVSQGAEGGGMEKIHILCSFVFVAHRLLLDLESVGFEGVAPCSM